MVNTRFTDSLVTHYQPSSFEKMLEGDLHFWEKRVHTEPYSNTALSRYAGALAQRFHTYGDIQDILLADTLLTRLNLEAGEKEASLLRALASLSITRHQFKKADAYAQKALQAGSEQYQSTLLLFDTQFELGSYTLANQTLASCASTNEYGYFFRKSKWEHLQGETDSALAYLQKAITWSGTSQYLKQTAQSNMADLYFHEGELQKAYDLYFANLQENASDFHSLQGIGRIALMHDKAFTAAEKIFRFIGSQNKLPDAYYNFIWLAEQKGDKAGQQAAALLFAAKATDTLLGGMYHKYLIEQYTGILNKPAIALAMAEKEMLNRATPQTYAWLAWCLHKAGQDARAMDIYKKGVSGKPLEALELYWMGVMMKEMGKSYNAEAFFKAAAKNTFDLSPEKQILLSGQLK